MDDFVTVLLVEDDDFDVESVQRAFHRDGLDNPIVVAGDGAEALGILRGERGTPPLPRPFIILLDLNMPRMGGLRFLEELRKDPVLTDAVVFVLTTSDHERDRCVAYRHNVAGYMLKDHLGRDLVGLTEMLSAYWRVVELPGDPD